VGDVVPDLIFLTVGTDHHRFDRVVEWADALADGSIDGSARQVVVQYGTSRPPSVAVGHAYLAGDELDALIRRSAVVVSHGGPATIMQIRDAGKIPVVVPRDPGRGEHVDGHQQRFVARLADEGKVVRVESSAELAAVIAAVHDGSRRLDVSADDVRVAAVVALVGDLIDALVEGSRRVGS
jgi:UDP-N-acetylglucosamine transferase subunit ALG13